MSQKRSGYILANLDFSFANTGAEQTHIEQGCQAKGLACIGVTSHTHPLQ